jgi:hypothetical protein
MKTIATQDLYAYWNALRGPRPAPRRGEIDPLAMPRALPEIFLLELQDSARIAVRLAGTRLCDLFGRELRGSSVSALWAPQSRAEVDQVLREVMDEAAVAVIAAEARWDGRSTGTYELVMAPLADDGGRCRYVIGALSPGEAPPLRGLERIDVLEVHNARLSWPSGLREGARFGRRPALTGSDVRQIGRFMVYDGGLALAAPETSTSH